MTGIRVSSVGSPRRCRSPRFSMTARRRSSYVRRSIGTTPFLTGESTAISVTPPTVLDIAQLSCLRSVSSALAVGRGSGVPIMPPRVPVGIDAVVLKILITLALILAQRQSVDAMVCTDLQTGAFFQGPTVAYCSLAGGRVIRAAVFVRS